MGIQSLGDISRLELVRYVSSLFQVGPIRVYPG